VLTVTAHTTVWGRGLEVTWQFSTNYSRGRTGLIMLLTAQLTPIQLSVNVI